MTLNRTLTQLRNTRDREEPEIFDYSVDDSEPPDGVRYMTLAEAQALDCNMCGQCCGSEEPDLVGFPLHQYAFGAIPAHQWRGMNGGKPLIIPLTPAGRPRAWRPADAESSGHPPFRCDALRRHPDGTTRCALWQARRPVTCNEFPVNAKRTSTDLRDGAYVLLSTTYQRLCTWVDVVLCPDDAIILQWRKRDGTLRRRLSEQQRDYVARVFREAYRDAFPKDGLMSLRQWRVLRRAEAAWRR